jgi:hypothetical protein
MGVSSTLSEAFFNNHSYHPQEHTLLAAEINNKEGVLRLRNHAGNLAITRPCRPGWLDQIPGGQILPFNKAEAASKKGLRITGQFDEESRNQFVQKGWTVVEYAGVVLFKK